MADRSRTMMSGGETVVRMLECFGVEIMFGLPGDQTDIYDALHRRSAIRHILVRQEQAAAHMADAYARCTGRVGVCDAAVGPGAANLVGGLAEAYTSGIPVLAIISDIRTDWRGRGCFQEIDQIRLFRPITKAVFDITHAMRIPELMVNAFRIAATGRPGPVVLNLPLDVLKAEHEFDTAEFQVDARYGRFPAHRPLPAEDDIKAVAEALTKANAPVIVTGGGVIASGAMEEVQNLAELLDVPVATTFMGKGTMPENHPLALGPYGLLGRPLTNTFLLDCDFVLALGTRFTNVDTAAWRIPKQGTRLMQIDIDPAQIGRQYPVERAVTADLKTALGALFTHIKAENMAKPSPKRRQRVMQMTEEWRRTHGIESTLAKDEQTAPVHPLQLIRALRIVMKDDDMLICDSGFNQIWGGQYFELRSSGRFYMGPRGFGIMGFSLPSAIACALAYPERRVFALCGDGGFAMVMQELETALRTGVKITVCIVNNSSLQYIRENQRQFFDNRLLSTEFSSLDYAAIACAFGWAGWRVEQSGDLEAVLRKAAASDKPAVVDVQTAKDAVPERISLQSFA